MKDISSIGGGFKNEGQRVGPTDSLEIGGVDFTPVDDIRVAELTEIVVLLFKQLRRPFPDFEAEVRSMDLNVRRHFSVDGKPLN